MKDMAETYALVIRIQSYEYDGEFYFVDEGYGTPAEVLEYVAGDHLLRISDAFRIEDYLIDVLNEGQNASKDEYKAIDADVECWIHVDVDHRRYSFGIHDRVMEFSGEPTESEITSKVENLRS
jgi:hypothetical protein